MKGRIASKKAEISKRESTAPAGPQQRIRLHQPEETVIETEILGNSSDAAPKIVDLLDDLGVL